MFQTGYHATGYYQTGYYLGGADVPAPVPEVGRTTYGGFIPAKEPWIDKRKLIEQDDNEIISILVAAINAGVIR